MEVEVEMEVEAGEADSSGFFHEWNIFDRILVFFVFLGDIVFVLVMFPARALELRACGRPAGWLRSKMVPRYLRVQGSRDPWPWAGEV